MDTFLKIIGNEQVLNFVGTILGLLLTFLVGKYIRKHLRNEKEEIAWEAVEIAVSGLWSTMRRRFIEASEDGILNSEEKAVLRNEALREVMTFCKDKGFDVLAVFGQKFLELQIEKIVDEKHIRNFLSDRDKPGPKLGSVSGDKR